MPVGWTPSLLTLRFVSHAASLTTDAARVRLAVSARAARPVDSAQVYLQGQVSRRLSKKGRVMMQATKILNHFVGRLTRRARRAGLAQLRLAVAALLVFSSSTASAQAIPLTGAVGIMIVGQIKAITLDTPGDAFSSGTISIGTIPFAVAGGYTVSIPPNLLIDTPNKNVLTLQQFVAGAKVSGFAIEGVGFATILAHRLADGRIMAGSVAIQKGNELLTGEVTFINHTDGYVRINGTPNADIGGTIVRFDDPAGVNSIQQRSEEHTSELQSL